MEEKIIRRKAIDAKHKKLTWLLDFDIPHDGYFSVFNSARAGHLTDGDPTVDDFKISKFPWKTDYPFPLCRANVTDFKIDVCTDLMRQKKNYKRLCSIFRTRYKRFDRARFNEKHVNDAKKPIASVPYYLAQMAGGELQDPDPYCEAGYDFYYTRGFLNKLCLGGENYLIRPIKSLDVCIINVGSPQEEKIIPNDVPIYNINSYTDKNGNRSQFTLRHRNKFSLYSIDNALTEQLLFQHHDDIPIIDVQVKDNIIAYTNVKYKFNAFDINTNRLVHKCEFPLQNACGDLAQFQYDNNDLIFMGRNEVRVRDMRSKKEKTVDLSGGIFRCDHLASFCKSDQYLYVSSLHNIIKVDIREMAVVKKWTHMLQSPPIVTKIFEHDDAKGLIVANFDESLLLKIADGENCIPFKLLHMNDTLNRMELTMEQFHFLNEGLKQRLGLSTAGIENLEHKKRKRKGADMWIYSSNSVGDIFQQKVTTSEPDEFIACKELSKWASSLPNEPNLYKITDFRQMRDIKDLILTEPIEKNLSTIFKEYTTGFTLRAMKASKIRNSDMAAIWQSADMNPESKVTSWLSGVQDSNKMEWNSDED